MKKHIGLMIFGLSMAILTIIQSQYPVAGSFNESLSTPEIPLLGFWIVASIIITGCGGLVFWLLQMGKNDRINTRI